MKCSMQIFFNEFFIFPYFFAALCLSSLSVSALAKGGGLLNKKRTGADRGKEGAQNWQKCEQVLYG